MIYLLVVSIIWSLSFSLIKGNLTEVDPYFVSFSRLLISFIVFLPFIRIRRVKYSYLIHLLVIGALQYGLMYTAYINAYQYLKAYEIAVLTIFTPLFVVLIYDIWIKEFFIVHWTKALVAVLGAMIILYSDNFTFGFWKGIFLIQLSNLLFALGQVYYKQIIEKNSEVKQIEGFAVLFFGGVLTSSIFSLINTDFHSLSVNTDQLLTLIYLGAIASGLGFFLWNYGVTKAAAGTIAVMNNLKIPLGVIFSFILLNEDVNIIQLILGTIVFLAGFWIDSFKKLFIKN